MNEVDYLLKHKSETLNLREKSETKHQCYKPNLRRKWLTASFSKKVIFLLPICVFGGDGTLPRTGFQDLKHLSERITKHESSRSHLDSAVNLGLLDRANIAGNTLTSLTNSSWRIFNTMVNEKFARRKNCCTSFLWVCVSELWIGEWNNYSLSCY